MLSQVQGWQGYVFMDLLRESDFYEFFHGLRYIMPKLVGIFKLALDFLVFFFTLQTSFRRTKFEAI